MSADAEIFIAANALRVDLESPARHASSPTDAGAIATAGGPVHVPGVLPGCGGRAVGADGAATFSLPDTRVPLRFVEGEHRLVGRVGPGALIPPRPDGPPPTPPPQPGPGPHPPPPLMPPWVEARRRAFTGS